MKGHGAKTQESRAQGQEAVKLEISGGTKTPHIFSDADGNELKSFVPGEPAGGESGITTRRLEDAIYRDVKFGQAGFVWHKKHAISQAVREIYDGAVQLFEGGVE